MEQSRFEQLIELVGEAMERPPEEREAFLASASAEDDDLLKEALALVAEAGETSVADVTGRLEALVGRAAGDAVDGEPRQPSQIGPYEVLRPLGSGGMGVVYLGRQAKPIKRDVAIKVVRRAVADRDALARFEAERQALALMEHPGIARIFDAGTTDDGLPYFVMELVDGLPITEYCEERGLSLDERLELFHSVCEAVHHAHQRGVIHRDLKPSNVLIVGSERESGPQVKVIDFGIAKATDAILLDESFHTRAGSLVGTLDYMSPEQVRGDPVDVRADVYALGVILYQLVTGRHPFADTMLRRAGLLEAQKIILDSEPPRPSDTTRRRNVQAGSGAKIEGGSKGRRQESSPGRVTRDLDWIVMKALEKDRDRRYATALDFARDLERYARNEPVSAGPPGLPYRARKFIRRHRTGVLAAALVVLALLSGTVLAGVGFLRARAEARQAEAITTFLTDMLASVRPDEQGRAVTVRQVLDEARARIEAGEFSDDTETEASLALVIGHSYEGLGDFDPALDLIRRSVELRQRLYGPDDPRLYASLYRLGTVLWKRGALEEALALRLDLAEMTERTVGASHPDHAESLSNLGNTYADMGDFQRSAEYLREAVEVGRRLPGEEGELDLARFLNNLGTVYYDLEDFEAAVAVTTEALEIRERLLGEENDVYAITLGNLGDMQLRLGDLERAEATFRRAEELQERIYGERHPRTAHSYVGLSEVFLRQGRLPEAEEYIRRALDIRIATAADTYRRIASERRNLAEVLVAMGRYDEAGDELRTAWRGLVASGEESSNDGRDVAAAMAGLEERLGNEEEAAVWVARADGEG